MIKVLKVLAIVVGLIIASWFAVDLFVLVGKTQDLNSGYNIPHYYSESYVVLDERYRNDIVLTNALALAPDNVTIGMTGGRWTISNDMTIAENKHLFFDCDTYLYLPSNVTLTVNGSLDCAGHCLMIDGYGTVTGDILNTCIDPEWLGDDIVNGFDIPFCDEYATTNWVIWYVGDHFTNTIQPWVTNWVVDYVTNSVGDLTSTNWASLITNNYFIDGVTNNMETLIVRSNMTVNGYDYTDFISEQITFSYSASTVSIGGPVTYVDDWDGEFYDPYNAFTLTNGVFIPPKDGYYWLIGNVLLTVNVAAENNELDIFFDIDRAGSSKPYGYTTFTDDSSQMGCLHSRIYKLYTTNSVELAVYEEDGANEWIVQSFFHALYLGGLND